jgi:hypothetical protein
MLTARTFRPALPLRRVPEGEMSKKQRLAKELRGFWKYLKPSQCPLAPSLVYGRGFMNYEQPSDTLKERLRGRALVDLGAGRDVSFTAMAHFAAAIRASAYVAVDEYADYARAESLLYDFVNRTFPDIALWTINQDLLIFITEMETESANIVMNGIDNCMLNGPHWATGFYRMYLTAEIARVVPKGGVAFGMNSPDLHGLVHYGFQERFENPGYVFTKG